MCGKGGFSLLTGIGGEAWIDAARAVEKELGVGVHVHIIGPGQSHEDPYGQFAHRREIAETGALLVRPDFIVGWRAHEVSASATEDLLAAMKQILGRVDGVALTVDHVDAVDHVDGDFQSLKDDWL